jgi:hypothetical protein
MVALIYVTCYRKSAGMSHLLGASHLSHPNQVCLTSSSKPCRYWQYRESVRYPWRIGIFSTFLLTDFNPAHRVFQGLRTCRTYYRAVVIVVGRDLLTVSGYIYVCSFVGTVNTSTVFEHGICKIVVDFLCDHVSVACQKPVLRSRKYFFRLRQCELLLQLRPPPPVVLPFLLKLKICNNLQKLLQQPCFFL